MLSPRGMTPGPFRVGSAIDQCGLRCSGALVWLTCSARFDPQSDLHRRSRPAAPAPGQVEAVGDDGLWVSSRAATILARRMGKAPSVHSPEGMAERSVHN
jgi:hypothetical protein